MYHNPTSRLQVAESSFSSLPSQQEHSFTFLLPSLATGTSPRWVFKPPSLPLHVSPPVFPTVTALQVFIIDTQGYIYCLLLLWPERRKSLGFFSDGKGWDDLLAWRTIPKLGTSVFNYSSLSYLIWFIRETSSFSHQINEELRVCPVVFPERTVWEIAMKFCGGKYVREDDRLLWSYKKGRCDKWKEPRVI